MQALLGTRAAELGDLWLAWDTVRPLLLDDRSAEEPAGSEATEEANAAGR